MVDELTAVSTLARQRPISIMNVPRRKRPTSCWELVICPPSPDSGRWHLRSLPFPSLSVSHNISQLCLSSGAALCRSIRVWHDCTTPRCRHKLAAGKHPARRSDMERRQKTNDKITRITDDRRKCEKKALGSVNGYWTTSGYSNKRTGRLADWTSRRLVNSRMQPATLCV